MSVVKNSNGYLCCTELYLQQTGKLIGVFPIDFVYDSFTLEWLFAMTNVTFKSDATEQIQQTDM